MFLNAGNTSIACQGELADIVLILPVLENGTGFQLWVICHRLK